MSIHKNYKICKNIAKPIGTEFTNVKVLMGNIHKHLLKKPSTFYDTLIVRIQQKEPKCSEEKIYKKKISQVHP